MGPTMFFVAKLFSCLCLLMANFIGIQYLLLSTLHNRSHDIYCINEMAPWGRKHLLWAVKTRLTWHMHRHLQMHKRRKVNWREINIRFWEIGVISTIFNWDCSRCQFHPQCQWAWARMCSKWRACREWRLTWASPWGPEPWTLGYRQCKLSWPHSRWLIWSQWITQWCWDCWQFQLVTICISTARGAVPCC